MSEAAIVTEGLSKSFGAQAAVSELRACRKITFTI